MKYFFVLGSNPTLSIAELAAVFGNRNYDLLPNNILTVEIEEDLQVKKLIYHLGGTIKIGKVIGELDNLNTQKILEIIKANIPDEYEGKYKFGFSNYSHKKTNLKVLGMETKKLLSEKDISCRWVTSREAVLSSVVVEQNKLADKGIEIVIAGREKIIIGQTLAVQPFKDLSFRDYGRPARDDMSGMLPPKLAQIMINLASPSPSQGEGWGEVRGAKDITILDPFCGSGTILTEAMLMDFTNLIGSDVSEKAVEDTEKNIAWIIKNYELRIKNYELLNKDVLVISKFVKADSIDAIITEPYLGPQRGKVEFKKVVAELEDLYSKSLAEFYKVLKSGGRVVMVWPMFVSHNTQHITNNNLNIDIGKFKIVNPVPESLRNNKFIQLTNRNTIVYGREGQKVWREIVVMGK
jgi:tRNA G10  N-methylase Trm11